MGEVYYQCAFEVIKPGCFPFDCCLFFKRIKNNQYLIRQTG
jgi:hypothetical protein